MWEIKFSGFGGQGIVRCALITGEAVSLHDDKFASMTQSFGPEARGGACQSQLIISDSRVLYPYCTTPGVLIALSQEAYDKYEPGLADGGILIIEEELVKPSGDPKRVKLYTDPRDALRRGTRQPPVRQPRRARLFHSRHRRSDARRHEKGAARPRARPLPLRQYQSIRKGYQHGLENAAKNEGGDPVTRRAGVFVCHCGTNIAATVDVKKVAAELGQ